MTTFRDQLEASLKHEGITPDTAEVVTTVPPHPDPVRPELWTVVYATITDYAQLVCWHFGSARPRAEAEENAARLRREGKLSVSVIRIPAQQEPR